MGKNPCLEKSLHLPAVASHLFAGNHSILIYPTYIFHFIPFVSNTYTHILYIQIRQNICSLKQLHANLQYMLHNNN